jgi:hypothetical protein
MVVFSRSLAGPTPSTNCKTVPIAVAFALVLRSHRRQVHFGSLTSDVHCGSLTSGRFIRSVHLFIVIPSEARDLSSIPASPAPRLQRPSLLTLRRLSRARSRSGGTHPLSSIDTVCGSEISAIIFVPRRNQRAGGTPQYSFGKC